ncbi:MAG: hypothetical protein H7644_07925 [Candidatus Heimdallarchaeota archaeon]|nr:hypothetical protein [Candidatus Heimdallarchaeota archaeon]MCK5143680.1 hypothetical protein [Candidatus Heimdallarchaeota archaeon]
MVDAWNNKVPLSAVIFETFISIILVVVVVLILMKYVQRRKKPVLYLFLTFSSFTLASVISTIGRWISYLAPDGSYLTVSYTDLTTMTAFLLIAISNCFVIAFVETVFANKGVDFALPFLVTNGIVVGMSLEAIVYWFSNKEFGLIRDRFYILVLLAIISLVSYGIMIYFAFKESRHNTEKLPRTGFNLIAVYGISVSLLFIFFALDSVSITLIAAFSKGYSPFYYLGWTFAMIGVFLGYLGYIMPGWLKKIIVKKDS